MMANASTITIAGKAPPKPDDLRRASARGFDDVELYLERSHLEDLGKTITIVEEAAVNVVSVHTPHVPIDDPEWLRRADRLASACDAYLVVHSNRILHTSVPTLERLNFRSAYGYENNPGISERHIRNTILDQGHEFVLDTAHLYMAEEAYVSTIERILTAFGDRIGVVHLCDSSPTKDGLGFGEGTMDMAAVSRPLKRQFEGIVVLEVMPDVQEAARKRLETYWNE